MKVAVLGASGWVGSHVLAELQQRQLETVGLVRQPTDSIKGEVRVLDVMDASVDYETLLADVDIVISAVAARAENNHEIFAETANRLLAVLPSTQVKRLIWVGGAGSLEVAPGVPLVSVPDFPEEYKDEALGQSQALEVFRAFTGELEWTFVSPAAELVPGEKQSQYRTTTDQLLSDAEGRSWISVADFAYALVDEVVEGKYLNQRIGFAY